MAEAKEQEPSIEEILESIRQIISEDVEGETKAAAAKPAPAAPPPQAAAPTPPSPKSSLDLSQQGKAAPTPSSLDLSQQKPAPVPQTPAAPLDLTEKISPVKQDVRPPEPATMTIDMRDKPMTEEKNSLISEKTADIATDALSKLLSTNVTVEREDVVGRPGKVTLEEITRELMRPMIKIWLDQNLPGIIERTVQKEVEKLSRRAMDR